MKSQSREQVPGILLQAKQADAGTQTQPLKEVLFLQESGAAKGLFTWRCHEGSSGGPEFCLPL